LPFEFAVAIDAIVLMLVCQRCLPKSSHGCNRDLGEKLLAIMVIELFDPPVAPRLGRRELCA
jgi:hypothetical protein